MLSCMAQTHSRFYFVPAFNPTKAKAEKETKRKKESSFLVDLQGREGADDEIGGEVEDEAICSKASGLKYTKMTSVCPHWSLDLSHFFKQSPTF